MISALNKMRQPRLRLIKKQMSAGKWFDEGKEIRDSKSRQAMRRQSRFYFTVSPTVVLWATELPVAVTVKCEFPVAAPADLVRVIVDASPARQAFLD